MKLKFHEIVLFFAISASLFHTQTAQTTVSEVSFTYDGTYFAFFQTTPVISHQNAQTQCNNWGGNLATIESAVEDSLLFYSIPDIEATFTCHIGLNDINFEAETNGDDFVWVDGSASSYRNWGTLLFNFPISTNGYDCVRHRYRSGGVLSQGWLNDACNFARNCYFCSKPVTSNGCDLIYDFSCYKLFGVGSGINWLDAQSSCAIWGGDLTSITTERENNYLNTLITSSVGNCWIGLNDRDVEGIYTWIDGTAVSYTNWTSTPSDDTNSNCVQINNAGNGIWESVSCGATLNAFLCKRDESSTVPQGGAFGEFIDGRVHFQTLESNIFLYDSLTLVCAGSENNAIQWLFSNESDFSESEMLIAIATYSNTEFDFSLLYADVNKQGYYRCMVDGAINHTVGLYNQSILVTKPAYSYTYIVGVDRIDIILLCDPQNNSYELNSLMWETTAGARFNNPIPLSEINNTSSVLTTQFACVADGVSILTCSISIYIPTVTVSYASSSQQTTTVFTATTEIISIPVGVKDFVLSTNLEGRWKLPNNVYIYSQTIAYTMLSYEYFGLYEFYVSNWDENEVIGIKINVVPGGYIQTIQTFGIFQNGSTIKLDEDTSLIKCASSVVVDHIDWFYRTSLDDIPINQTSNYNFSVETGISSLMVYSNQTGYYSCIINQLLECLFFVVERNQLVEVPNFNDPSQLFEYIVDSATVFLYYSFPNVPDVTLLWTSESVLDGDTSVNDVEFPNPAQLDLVFSQIGTGLREFTCFYRMSPVTVLGSLQLDIRDTAKIIVSFDGYNMSFSDLNNPIFPNPQVIHVNESTKNIHLTCSLSECVWNISHQHHPITTSTYTIPEITSTFRENVSLIRVTPSGVTYTTAHLFIVTIPKEIEVQIIEPFNTLSRTFMILFVILLITLIATILVSIGICVFKCARKVKSKDGIPSKNTNMPSKLNTQPVKFEDQQIPLSELRDHGKSATNSEHEVKIETNSPTHKTLEKSDVLQSRMNYNPEPESRIDSFYEFTVSNKPYEVHAHKLSAEVADRYIPKVISFQDYPKVYRTYVDDGFGKDSALSIEFQKLNEYSKKYIDLDSGEAMNPENSSKNPIGNIVPFNENRVLLVSPYMNNSNYINASWLELNQFIATLNPTKNTHQDFLQMIDQTGARIVVMLTTRKERVKIISGISNRVCYWCKKDDLSIVDVSSLL